MSANQPTASRRHAIALAAALTATVLTAIAAVGGLTRPAQLPSASAPPIVHVVPQRPAAPVQGFDD